jgi:hypothetical protein
MERRFQYSVVRYVPNIVRDEAVNVGVLMRAVDATEFEARFLPRGSAVRKLWPTADREIVRNFERELEKAATEGATLFGPEHPLLRRFGVPTDPGFIARARAEFVGNLQLTAPRGIVANDLGSALNWAYRTYVEEPSSESRPINYQSMAPQQMRDRLWRVFQRRDLIRPEGLTKRLLLEGRHAPWTFDLGYRNGSLNLINSIALNAETADTNLGRSLVFKGMIDDVAAKQADVHAIAVVRTHMGGRTDSPGSREALAILDDSGIEAVQISQIDGLADRVERELAHSA